MPALVANVVSSFWPQNSSASNGIVSSFLIRLTVEPEGDEALGAICSTPQTPHCYRATAVNDMMRYATVFDGVTPWRGHVPPGYLVDFCGAMTAAELTNENDDPRFRLMVGDDSDRLVYTRLPRVADGEVWFEAANWVMAAREARERFVMMTLGANYGAQAVCSYRVAATAQPDAVHARRGRTGAGELCAHPTSFPRQRSRSG